MTYYNALMAIALIATHAIAYYWGKTDAPHTFKPTDAAWVTVQCHEIDKKYEYARWSKEHEANAGAENAAPSSDLRSERRAGRSGRLGKAKGAGGWMIHAAAEIIHGLKCIGGNSKFLGCSDCPWHGKGLPPCRIAVCESAIAYIESEEESRCINVLDAVTG